MKCFRQRSDQSLQGLNQLPVLIKRQIEVTARNFADFSLIVRTGANFIERDPRSRFSTSIQLRRRLPTSLYPLFSTP